MVLRNALYFFAEGAVCSRAMLEFVASRTWRSFSPPFQDSVACSWSVELWQYPYLRRTLCAQCCGDRRRNGKVGTKSTPVISKSNANPLSSCNVHFTVPSYPTCCSPRPDTTWFIFFLVPGRKSVASLVMQKVAQVSIAIGKESWSNLALLTPRFPVGFKPVKPYISCRFLVPVLRRKYNVGSIVLELWQTRACLMRLPFLCCLMYHRRLENRCLGRVLASLFFFLGSACILSINIRNKISNGVIANRSVGGNQGGIVRCWGKCLPKYLTTLRQGLNTLYETTMVAKHPTITVATQQAPKRKQPVVRMRHVVGMDGLQIIMMIFHRHPRHSV